MGNVWADTPAFDRPGIAFSTGTIPAGTLALEQGAPDFERTSDAGRRTTFYSFDSRLRVGLTNSAEVQVGASLFNQMQTHESGDTSDADGHGDATLAVKVALPSAGPRFAWATLGSVTFANGSDQFTNGSTAYDLGVSSGYALGDDTGGVLYVNLNRVGGSTSFDVSPSVNFAITQSLAGFIEAGATFGDHGLGDAVAGGGCTLMVTRTVQIDLSADFGLTGASPRVIAGFGVSIFMGH